HTGVATKHGGSPISQHHVRTRRVTHFFARSKDVWVIFLQREEPVSLIDMDTCVANNQELESKACGDGSCVSKLVHDVKGCRVRLTTAPKITLYGPLHCLSEIDTLQLCPAMFI